MASVVFKKLIESDLVFWSFVFAAGENAFAAGWGMTNYFSQQYPEFLQFLAVRIISFFQCNNQYGHLLTSHHICAGTMIANKSTSKVNKNTNKDKKHFMIITH